MIGTIAGGLDISDPFRELDGATRNRQAPFQCAGVVHGAVGKEWRGFLKAPAPYRRRL